jgi:hypothetical protein
MARFRLHEQAVLGQAKTLDSDAGLPLPGPCLSALEQLVEDRKASPKQADCADFVFATGPARRWSRDLCRNWRL